MSSSYSTLKDSTIIPPKKLLIILDKHRRKRIFHKYSKVDKRAFDTAKKIIYDLDVNLVVHIKYAL